VDDATAEGFNHKFERILSLRADSYRLGLEAEAAFEKALGGSVRVDDWGERGFAVRAAAFERGRRRLEASVHNPGAAEIRRHLAKHGTGFTEVEAAGYDVWLPTRFHRVPAIRGVQFVDSADLTEVNPDLTKRIADSDFGDPYRGRVEPGWILLARSGQTYGIIGTVVLAGRDLEGLVVSDHVMRLRAREDASVQRGYLATALSHPTLGRPLVKSLAYGSSIPELDVSDIERFEVVRLSEDEEHQIAELAEAAATARSNADVLEREMAKEASAILAAFTSGRA
jgi:hypothetical protein